MAKRKHHTPVQIIRKLEDAYRLLSVGQNISQACQALLQENVRLKRMVADLMLDREMLKDLAEGTFWARYVVALR